MAKSTQMMKMNVFGQDFSVVFRPSVERNPFYLYHTTRGYNKYGVFAESRKQIARYANFESCLYHLLQLKLPEFRKDVFC